MNFLQKIFSLKDKLLKFFLEDIWNADLKVLSFPRRFFYSFFRVVMIAVRDFINNRCSLQASALTYITLVSMVPILAIMFSFSKGLGMQNRLMAVLGLEEVRQVEIINGKRVRTTTFRIVEIPDEKKDEEKKEENKGEKVTEAELQNNEQKKNEVVVTEELAAEKKATPESTAEKTVKEAASLSEEAKEASGRRGRRRGNAAANDKNSEKEKPSAGVLATSLPAPMQQVLVNIFNYVEKTSFATLGLVGSLMLLCTVILSMAKLENSFNAIWGGKKSRPLLRKVSEYLVVLILMPIVFLAATSINALVSSNGLINYLSENAGALAWLIEKTNVMLVILFVAGGFTFFYIFMPNTTVKFFPAAMAGIITGMLWFAVYWAYIVLQVGLTNYNAIYGTFAVVPFFLAWLYANWSIILIGAEVSYAVQNFRTIQWGQSSEILSPLAGTVLGMVVVLRTCDSFVQGEGPWDAFTFASDNGISPRMLRPVLETLQNAKIILPMEKQNQEETNYLPAMEPKKITLAMVEDAFRSKQRSDADPFMKKLPEKIKQDFGEMYQNYQEELSERNFADLLKHGNGEQS